MGNIMEPHRGFIGEGLFPGAPGVDCLSLAGNKPPVIGANALGFQVAQNWIEPATGRTGHVLGTENRPAVPLSCFDVASHFRRWFVIVKLITSDCSSMNVLIAESRS